MKQNERKSSGVVKVDYSVFGEYPVKTKKKDEKRKYVVPWELTNKDLKDSF